MDKMGKKWTLLQTSTETFTNDGYQVSVLVTNNVTNIPHYNLGWNSPKTIPTYNQEPTFTHCKLETDWSLMVNKWGAGK